jgi:LemA protein
MHEEFNVVASSTLLVWSLAALMLFWAIGAYNRLVRLRAQTIAAFATLEQTMVGLPMLIEADFSHLASNESSSELERSALIAAGKRLADALRVARAAPLTAAAVDELSKAYQDLGASWSQLRDLPDGLSAPDVFAAAETSWNQISLLVQVARADFNRRVQLCNDAIGQFPALLVASGSGLKPGQALY